MSQTVAVARSINEALNNFRDYASGKIADDDEVTILDPATFYTIDKDSSAYPSTVDDNGDTIVYYVKSTVSFSQELIKNKLMPDGEIIPLAQPDQVA